ncbi:hypothetical protein IML52_08640 [Aggregatibacter actinomycetemcomitans]|uniref:hypothetical protein n=1 Tax=Aggregatibacter actinomycetemcomitans TaxID=714 RepID=UPI001E40FDB1|nr:hypothetical protein [Aggregatibacter actinomycetemcomitans]MCE3057802.1 hypothetical protein [Aggregatibacter actinomycetemcomitans]
MTELWVESKMLIRDDDSPYAIQKSMSRRGNCYDNAVIERFFQHVEVEVFYS